LFEGKSPAAHAGIDSDAKMIAKLIVFLGVILTLTIGAHLLLYKALIRLFVIAAPAVKTLLFMILLLLSLSFMASFFLLRWQNNPFTVGFYMFSAVWTGLFFNLLPAVLLAWISSAIIRFTGSHLNTRLIASGCILMAVLFSIYGMRNAFAPRTKSLDVAVDNLPDQWKNKTVVQLSDVHLGHFYGVGFLQELVRKVNGLKPELIFITGDLFDGMAADISQFAADLNQLKAVKGVFFVTGNHETYVGLNRAIAVLEKTKIKILHNKLIEIDGLQIIGISYPGIKDAKEIRGLEKVRPDPSVRKPRILLFHTPTNISPKGVDGPDRHFATHWLPDTRFSLAKKLGVDLQMSGHTHAGQIFPFGYLTKLLYKGYDWGLQRSGNFSIYTTSGVGTWGPPMRTGNAPEIVVMTLRQVSNHKTSD